MNLSWSQTDAELLNGDKAPISWFEISNYDPAPLIRFDELQPAIPQAFFPRIQCIHRAKQGGESGDHAVRLRKSPDPSGKAEHSRPRPLRHVDASHLDFLATAQACPQAYFVLVAAVDARTRRRLVRGGGPRRPRMFHSHKLMLLAGATPTAASPPTSPPNGEPLPASISAPPALKSHTSGSQGGAASRYTSKVSFDTYGDNVPNDLNAAQFSFTLQVSSCARPLAPLQGPHLLFRLNRMATNGYE